MFTPRREMSSSDRYQAPDQTSAGAHWSQTFSSACELAKCFAKLGKTISVVQLSRGPLKGLFSAVNLDGISLIRISTNQMLLVNGERGEDCLSFSLEITGNNGDHRVQCEAFQSHALYGFNQGLQDAHFQLSAGSISIISITSAQSFNAFLTRTGHHHLIEPLLTSNHCNMDAASHQRLARQLSQPLIHPPCSDSERRTTTQDLLASLLSCLQLQSHHFVPFELSSRNQLIKEFVRWGITNSSTASGLDAICKQLYTSRRTLILGSKDNFNCGPMELLRTIRLQQVHGLLRSQADRQRQGLQQVSDVAAFYGFRSRGHFARAYQDHFAETPRTTLLRSA